MGSVLFAARAEPTGLVMAGCCAVGVIVPGAMRRRPGTDWSLSTSPTMLLLVAVVQASKADARRHLPRPEPTSDNGGS